MLDIEVVAQSPQAEDRPPVEGFSAWYDASDRGSIGSGPDGQVAEWRDKSAGARHMTQATTAYRPVSGSWSQNGRNVVFGHSGTQHMSSSAPPFGITAQPWTAFVVAMHYRGTNQQTAWSASQGESNEIGRNYRAGGGAISVWANAGFSSPLNWELGRPRVVSTVFNGGSSQLVVDGYRKTTGSLANPGGFANGARLFAYGFSEYFEGWIGEVVVYPRRCTDIEIQRVEAYLTRKWGIA